MVVRHDYMHKSLQSSFTIFMLLLIISFDNFYKYFLQKFQNKSIGTMQSINKSKSVGPKTYEN